MSDGYNAGDWVMYSPETDEIETFEAGEEGKAAAYEAAKRHTSGSNTWENHVYLLVAKVVGGVVVEEIER